MCDDEFPTPRRSSAMFIYRHQLMLWGGLTQLFIGEGEQRFMFDTDIPGNVHERPLGTCGNRGSSRFLLYACQFKKRALYMHAQL